MRKQSDTYTLAYECCDTVLMEDGRFPTIEAIRDRIGVNSPTVISRAIKDWTLHFVEKHRQSFERPDLPVVMLDAATGLWQLALKEANQSFSEQRQALEQRAAEDQTLIAQLRQQLQEEQSRWEATLAEIEHQLDEQVDQNAELVRTLADTERTLKDTDAQWVATREELSRTEGSLTALKSAHDAQTKEWSDRFDKQHNWHLHRIEQEKMAARQEHAKTIATLERALEEARLDRATSQARINQLMQQLSDRHEHQLKWEADFAQLREQLASRDAALQAEKNKVSKLQELVRKQRRPASSVSGKVAG